MKVFVSGASGFLGSAFHAYHRKQGDEVLAVDIVPSDGVFHIDASEIYRAGGKHFDIAYHFAAHVGGRTVIEGNPLAQAGNFGLDAEFFRWAVSNANLAVYPSSSAVYGIKFQSGEGRALSEGMFNPAEDMWPAPDELYGMEKLAGEYLAFKAADHYGLSVLAIRPFSGYGPNQSLDYPVPAICLRALKKEDPLTIWGSGSQSRDFVFIDDLVGATMARLQRSPYGYAAMNIGTGKATTFAEIARLAADIVGYNPQIVSDESKPQGVHARYADPTEMLRWYTPSVNLETGLNRVMESLSSKVS